MTTQLALADCDPDWTQPGTGDPHDPHDTRWSDLRGQGITKAQYHQIADVTVVGDYL